MHLMKLQIYALSMKVRTACHSYEREVRQIPSSPKHVSGSTGAVLGCIGQIARFDRNHNKIFSRYRRPHPLPILLAHNNIITSLKIVQFRCDQAFRTNVPSSQFVSTNQVKMDLSYGGSAFKSETVARTA